MLKATFAFVFYLVLLSPLCSAELRYSDVDVQSNRLLAEVASFERFTRQEDNTITNITQDSHIYYTSVYLPPGQEANDLWFELSDMVGSGVEVDDDLQESVLSGLHRRFELHDLKFQFPFYGHTVETLAVTTGGFLYVGDLLHDQIHLTQYIAPLQADFNPSSNDTARILVLNTEERFTVQWDQVHNNDHITDGPFTFQVSLFPNGNIHFVYKEIPLLLNNIDNEGHPVEVGLADAFYFRTRLPQGTLITIVQYHEVQLNSTLDLSNSAYILTPLLNCVSATSQEECDDVGRRSNFECDWCCDINRCSDGVDRHRQEWINSDCNEEGASVCSKSSGLSQAAKRGITIGVVGVVLLLLLVLLIIATLIYGYRRPHSKVGMFMIEHRPKAWSLNKVKEESSYYDVKSDKTVL